MILRERTLRIAGWTLLLLSLVLLAFHVLWMWKRLGHVAPIVAAAIAMDAVVGVGLIIAGSRIHRKQDQSTRTGQAGLPGKAGLQARDTVATRSGASAPGKS